MTDRTLGRPDLAGGGGYGNDAPHGTEAGCWQGKETRMAQAALNAYRNGLHFDRGALVAVVPNGSRYQPR